MLQYFEVDQIRIPCGLITSFSYSKRGNVIETKRNEFICRGFSCQEIAVAFSIEKPAIGLFEAVGVDYSWGDLCDMVLSLEPNIENPPSPVYLAGNRICPELLFSLTSITCTPQADLNGNISRIDVSMALSGSACSKESATDGDAISYDENAIIPKVSITCNGKTAICQDSIAISDLILTPTTLHLGLLLADSHTEKNPNAWVYTLATDKSAFVDVDGFGRYYVQNAQTDEDSVSYECSVFSKESDVVITDSMMQTNLGACIARTRLNTSVQPALAKIPVDYYTIHRNSVDTLKELAETLGFIVAFRDGGIQCVDLPERIFDASDLNYYITDDVVSAPTTKVVFRDGLHEYTAGTDEGFTNVVNSPVCTGANRAESILRLRQFMERGITITIPWNSKIKHYSAVKLNYTNNSINCLVTDYSIDVLQNTMTLRLNYLER